MAKWPTVMRRLAALGLAVAAGCAQAQSWPVKPVRLIVPYPPGGVLDALVRSTAERLQSRLGQPFIVENMPGAGGNIGLSACARAAADGTSFCMTTNDLISINPFLYSKMPVDPRDLMPVQRLVWVNGVIFAPTSAGVTSLADLFTQAAKKPPLINWGSFGIGSSSHLYMGWLNQAKSVEMVHIPYKGSAPLLQAALGGEVQVGMLATGILMPHIRAGKIVPLAVLGDQRLDSLPNVPSMAESGLSFYVKTWFGVFAPKGTPAPIVEKLNAELVNVMADTAFVRDTVLAQGLSPATTSVRDFASYLVGDRANGEKLVAITGVKLD